MSFTPIFTYHKVAIPPPDTIYPGTYVRPATFAAHVAYLARHFEPVTLGDYLGARTSAGRAVLTFDDGTEDFASAALPILLDRGAGATVFLVTGESINLWDVRLGDREVRLLTPEQIRAVGDGVEFGSHTRTHADLGVLPEAEFHTEIVRSRAEVTALTGRPCRTFCYPYGRKRDAAIDAVRRAGYDGAVSTEKGANDALTDPFRLRRIAVRHDTSLPVLVYKIWRARRFAR